MVLAAHILRELRPFYLERQSKNGRKKDYIVQFNDGRKLPFSSGCMDENGMDMELQEWFPESYSSISSVEPWKDVIAIRLSNGMEIGDKTVHGW